MPDGRLSGLSPDLPPYDELYDAVDDELFSKAFSNHVLPPS